jgi:predicted transposase YbfD/YdcC
MECSIDLEQIVIPERAQGVDAQTLYAVLDQVKDKRKARGKRYETALVLTLLLLAKMSGQSRMSGIAQWARLRIEWVKAHLPLTRESLPCGNTYHNVCDQIDLNELNQRLADFFAPAAGARVELEQTAVEPKAAAQPLRQWVLDGKSLRGSHRPAHAQQAQSVLSLYDVRNQHVVAQRELAGKGHERTTALALVQELDLSGVLLSADALHTQPAWCHAVRRQGGDYLLIVKANQRLLRSDIALLFSDAPKRWLPEQSCYQVNQGHGRLEVRTIRTSTQLNDYIAAKWCDVAQVFQLQRRITRQRRTTTETVYGITSLSARVAPPRHLLHFIRQYWQIENRLHWRRDVTLGEDGCTVSRGQTPQVLAMLNNVILALVDRLAIPNLAAQQRVFDAHPQDALNLILYPI